MKHLKMFEGYSKHAKYQKIVQMPEFRALIEEMGYEVISSQADQEELDFCFAFPEYFVAGDREAVSFANPFHPPEGSDYLEKGILIWRCPSRTIIRPDGSESIEMGNCNFPIRDFEYSTTLKDTLLNWKVLLLKARGIMQQWQDEYEKAGAKLLITPEEREPLRGRVAGKKFDF